MSLARFRYVVLAALAGSFLLLPTTFPVSAQGLDDLLRALIQPPPVQRAPARPREISPVQPQRNTASPMVLQLQGQLNRLGYDAGPVDGAFGPRTRGAMNAFQRDYGLPQTQSGDLATLQALDLALNGRLARMPVQPEAPRLPPAPMPSGVQASAQGPGFDCGQAGTPSERAICASPDLARMDRDLSVIYAAVLEREAQTGATVQRDNQRGFLAARNACGENAACLSQAYLKRTGELIAVAMQQGLGVTPTVSGLAVMPFGAPISAAEANAPTSAPQSGTFALVAEPGAAARRLDVLQTPPPAVKPWKYQSIDGIPILSSDQVTALIDLIRIGDDPSHLERHECDLARLYLEETALAELARAHSCNGAQLSWLGGDEFARADMRARFYRDLAPSIIALAPALPLTFAVVDRLQVGEFQAETLSFPLRSQTSLLEAIIEPASGSSLRYAANSGTRRDIPRIASVNPLPEARMPMESASAARDFINRVNSWPVTDGFSTPAKTGQRAVKRVSVIEFLAFDRETRRLDTRLWSAAIYDWDLAQKIYEMPVAPPTASVVAGGLSTALDAGESLPLDRTYGALRHIGAAGELTEPQVFQALVEQIQNRDRAYYDLRARGPASPAELSENDARKPFFGRGDYEMTESRWPVFVQWAQAYAAALPDRVEVIRDYTNYSLNAGETYTFPAISNDTGTRRANEQLAALGIQPEQVVSARNLNNALIVLPNRVGFFNFEVPGAMLEPHAQKQLHIRTRLRANGEVLFIDGEYGRIPLIPLDPQRIAIEVDGVEIAVRTFEDVPRLGDTLIQASGTDAQAGKLFAEPQPLSQASLNILLAAALVPDDATMGGLVVQRWHLEQPGDATGGTFFVPGARMPSDEEANALAGDFSRWARQRVDLPGEIVLSAPIERRETAGDGLAWTSLGCTVSALSQDDRILISSNSRRMNVENMRKEQAIAGGAGYGAWRSDDDIGLSALALEPRAAHLVVRLTCDQHAMQKTAEPLHVYATMSSLLPNAPANAATAQLRLRIKSISRDAQRPHYRSLLPQEIVDHLVTNWQPQSGAFVKMDAELVEVAYLDEAGIETARLTPAAEQSLTGMLAAYRQGAETVAEVKTDEPYGFDLIGIKVGMSFEQAEEIVRAHMKVAQVLTGTRALDGSLQTGFIRPGTSGKLFISEEGNEYIAILDEAPAVEGRVLVAWRRLYLAANTLPVEEVFAGLGSKYGEPGRLQQISEGIRNFWSTPAGNGCEAGYKHGGQRPALAASWTEQGQAANLLDAFNQPLPDAMLPMAIQNAAKGDDPTDRECGPTFTAEIVFNASRMARSGYQTQERDWIETIISDVGPYVEAFEKNRDALRQTGAQPGAVGVRF